MVQAAARGVVDFSDANLLDRRWWLKIWWLLDQLESDNLTDVRRMQHMLHCGLIQYGLEEKAFDTHWEQATKGIHETWNTLFPWNTMDGATADARSRLRQAWVNKYGDPSDPDTQRRIQLTVDYLKSMRNPSKKRKPGRKLRVFRPSPRRGK